MKPIKSLHVIDVLLAACLLSQLGCGGRPTEEMSSAERALADAALAERCAPEEFRAAQRMYAKAEKYAEAEEYSKAHAAAKAAEQIAKKAQAKALARKDECLKAARPDTTDDDGQKDAADSDASQLSADRKAELSTVYFKLNAFKLSPRLEPS